MGGIEIPHEKHALGHSDADVLLHALVDALLGAAALGDIGELFPNTDPANRDRDSAEMLDIVARKVADAGYRVVNVDAVIHAERPKLSQHKTEIRGRLAQLLGIELQQIGLKAKTGEGVGPVGTEQAIEARCVVLIEPLAGR